MKSVISAFLGAALVVSVLYFEPAMAIIIGVTLILVVISSFPKLFDDSDYTKKAPVPQTLMPKVSNLEKYLTETIISWKINKLKKLKDILSCKSTSSSVS